MSEQLGEANGFAHAYSTWISQGNGLDTKRDGVFRYKAGPMKGMTRDQAQMHFQNKVWANASPEWKNEYAKRATSDLLAPSEQSDLEKRKQSDLAKRKAFASGVTQPQYQARNRAARVQTPENELKLLKAERDAAAVEKYKDVADADTVQEFLSANREKAVKHFDGLLASKAATPAKKHGDPAPTAVKPMQNDGMATPTPAPAPAAITPPTFNQKQAAAQQRNATSVAKTAQAIQGKAPSNTPAGQFDIMKADYSTLTPEQKAQRTQANVDRMKQKATSMGMAEEMPAISVTAPRMKPLETKFDMAQGRIVQTGGDADEAFTNYDKAQKAAQAGTATAQQRQTVVDYGSQDVLGRQPWQIAKQRDDERKGYYQAGRYVGPPQGQAPAPRMPVSAPVFASGGKRSNPAPVATRQPSFGNRAGTGATRMPI